MTVLAAKFAVAGDGVLYLADQKPLYFIKGNEVFSADTQTLLWFRKGNIFFTGNSDSKDNICMMVSATNWETGNGSIYDGASRTPSISFSLGKFYALDDGGNQIGELLHLQKHGKWLAFYSSINDSLLAYFPEATVELPNALLMSFLLIKKYNLTNQLMPKVPTATFSSDVFSVIKPTWGNTTDNEWIWDGKVLKPRWIIDPQLQWTFDGRILKPLYGTNAASQYEWDGEYLKPMWIANRNVEWTWDGRLMKPVWGTDWANQYLIDNNIVKPWSGVHTEREWQIDGQIPIPVIMLVISGLSRYP